MTSNEPQIELHRQELQTQLDTLKTSTERNILGQYATPFAFAEEIVEQTQTYFQNEQQISFLDPAFGTGVFYSALLSQVPLHRIQKAQGFEIDPHYATPTRNLWNNWNIQLDTVDFTDISAPVNENDKYNLIICNPPYVRHHHIQQDKKEQLQRFIRFHWNYTISGLTGLYCYFLFYADCWLRQNGIGCWLIPNEFLDVNYGKILKTYLTKNVTLLRIHKFSSEDVKFHDALVTSVIVWIKKQKPLPDETVVFSSGKSLRKPKYEKRLLLRTLNSSDKWTRYFGTTRILQNDTSPLIGDYFTIKRGIATGDNNFFILPESKIARDKLPIKFFRPILPSPRYLSTDIIESFQDGTPNIEKRLFLLDCQLAEETVEKEYPLLWMYLVKGRGTVSDRYICRHRTPWYRQEHREPTPFLCTYMGRNEKPFRFVLNKSQAIAANVYLLLYPKPVLKRLLEQDARIFNAIWECLNNIDMKRFIQNGRVYGGGLHKLEPRELHSIPIPEFSHISPELQLSKGKQEVLF